MKLKFKFDLKREIKIGAALLVVVLFIAFTERRQGNISINDVSIKIENTNENHFLEEADILHLMQLNPENLKGAEMGEVDLKVIERNIKAEPFIRDAEL